MTAMTAKFHGANKRRGYNLLVEVFHPRKGIASQYVEGRFANDGKRICFDVLRDNDITVTFSIPNTEGTTFPPFPLATH